MRKNKIQKPALSSAEGTEDGKRKIEGTKSFSTLRSLSSAVCLPFFIASAAMLTVIQPPISLSALAWVALVPFIIACSPEAKPTRLFLISFIVSFGYWLGNLYWVAPITIIGWIAVCAYTALLWPALALSLRFCRMKKVPLFLASAVLVVGT